MSQCIYTIIYNFKELNIFGDQFFWHFEKKTFMGRLIENNEYEDEFCISKKNHVNLYVFFHDVIFLVFVFWRFLCKFSINRELSFMLKLQKREKIKKKYIFSHRSQFKPDTGYKTSI